MIKKKETLGTDNLMAKTFVILVMSFNHYLELPKGNGKKNNKNNIDDYPKNIFLVIIFRSRRKTIIFSKNLFWLLPFCSVAFTSVIVIFFTVIK